MLFRNVVERFMGFERPQLALNVNLRFPPILNTQFCNNSELFMSTGLLKNVHGQQFLSDMRNN